jgi:hypothetical protein
MNELIQLDADLQRRTAVSRTKRDIATYWRTEWRGEDPHFLAHHHRAPSGRARLLTWLAVRLRLRGASTVQPVSPRAARSAPKARRRVATAAATIDRSTPETHMVAASESPDT